MSLLRKKAWWQHPIALRIFLLVLILLCIFLTLSVYERYTIEREMAERRAVTEAELQELEERKAVLEERVDYLQGERGVEAEMRQHFDVAREGEQVVVLVNNERPEPTPVSTTTIEEESWSFWSWLLP